MLLFLLTGADKICSLLSYYTFFYSKNPREIREISGAAVNELIAVGLPTNVVTGVA